MATLSRPVMPYVRSGDWLILFAAGSFVTWLCVHVWIIRGGDTLIVRSSGKVIVELPLARDRITSISGPLGTTTVQIENRRARIQADPGPRQYCVKQGWIEQSGEAAICLPNQVSIEVSGGGYDSLNY
jgi:hypothetical protein